MRALKLMQQNAIQLHLSIQTTAMPVARRGKASVDAELESDSTILERTTTSAETLVDIQLESESDRAEAIMLIVLTLKEYALRAVLSGVKLQVLLGMLLTMAGGSGLSEPTLKLVDMASTDGIIASGPRFQDLPSELLLMPMAEVGLSTRVPISMVTLAAIGEDFQEEPGISMSQSETSSGLSEPTLKVVDLASTDGIQASGPRFQDQL